MRQGWGTPPNTVRVHRREPGQVVHVARERPAEGAGTAADLSRTAIVLVAAAPHQRRESLYLYAVASGRITHVEMFELDAREAALARFEALRPLVPARPH